MNSSSSAGPTSSDPNPNPNPVQTWYNNWVETTPFVTRTTLTGITILLLISFFIDFDMYLGNIPFYTIEHLQFYRIFLSPLVGNSIFSVLMIFFFFPQMAGKIESSMGSSATMVLMCVISILTNLLFIGTTYLLSVVGMPQAIGWNCSGYWIIVFAFITIDCMQMPDAPRQLMFIPVDIPSKYLPLVLYGIFVLFSGPELSFAISIGLGYLQSQGYLDRLRVSSYALEQMESNGILHSISRSKGWILSGGALGHDAWIPVNVVDPDMPSSSTSRSTGAGGMFSGLSNVSGMDQWSNNSSEDRKENAPFPGSGRTLASGGTTSVMTLSSGSTHSSNPMTKEAIAARRLAALGVQDTKSPV